ncbi:MAG: hypothetical protein EOO81_10495, partial [Oxalobacteraceae bacterium]
MEADNKELDKTIAERIMGWRRMSVDTKNGSVEYWLGPKHENQMEPPAFSTDQELAWQVAETVRLKHPAFSLLNEEVEGDFDNVVVEIGQGKGTAYN